MYKKRTVALVMPVRNEEENIKETLDDVMTSTRLPDECICADGRSTDRTVEMIEAYDTGGRMKIRVVDNPTIFCGGGRNRAIETTDCEVILLSDFGNKMEPTWIENMVRPFETDPEVDAVAGMFKPLVKTEFEHCMAAIHYYQESIMDSISDEEREAMLPEVVLPGGLSIGFTKDIWERAGTFPEWLAKGQDKMFSRKMAGLGAKVAVAWDAWIEHHMRSTPKEVFKQLFLYGRGYGQMRFVSGHIFKLAGFYLFFAALVAMGFLWSPFFGLAGALMLAYVYHSGIRKVYQISKIKKRPFSWKHLFLAPVVLWCRDIGTLLGQFTGWMYWFFVPKYRKLFEEYTKNIQEDVLKTVAR